MVSFLRRPTHHPSFKCVPSPDRADTRAVTLNSKMSVLCLSGAREAVQKCCDPLSLPLGPKRSVATVQGSNGRVRPGVQDSQFKNKQTKKLVHSEVGESKGSTH